MAHLAHTPFRRRLKTLLLVFGFALFVVMAVLTARQASDPKLSGGRHAVAAPRASPPVPVAAADHETTARSLAPAEPVPTPPAAAPSAASQTAPAAAPPTDPTTDEQSAALQQTLTLSANLQAAMHRSPAAAAGRQ